MTLTVTTPATAYPVTLSEAKFQLGYTDDETEFDAIILQMIGAATGQAEALTQCRFMPQVITAYIDTFPDGSVDLGVYPVQSIDSLSYVDADGATQALAGAGADYWSSLAGMYPAAAPVTSWPATQSGRPDAVTVVMSVGYASAYQVPITVKAAILMRVHELFDNRGETTTASTSKNMNTMKTLLESYTRKKVY